MKYGYEARTRDGAATRGHVVARDRRRAGQLLQKKDLFVVNLQSERDADGAQGSAPHATPTEVAWHIWQLSMMIETGLGLADALSCLARQARRPGLRALLTDVERRVREGSSMSAAMESHPRLFPSSLTALVRASELSGAFKDVLRKASQYLMSDLKAARRIRGAMIYPAAMLLICLAVVTFLLTVILPKFAAVFAAHGAALPLPTRVLMSVSDGLMERAHVWLIAVTGAVAGAMFWARSPSGRRQIDHALVNAPVIAPLFNAVYQSRSFMALALMLEAHVPLLDALRIAQSTIPNSCYRSLWRDIEEQVRVGERMAVPLYEAAFIPESVAQVIDNGDRNGKLALVFTHLAEFFDEEYKRVLAATMQLIEPCLIIVMGAFIGFVAVALMLPLVQASQAIAH